MQMTSEQMPNPAGLAILRLNGSLDGSNYQEVISKAHELYKAGARLLLIDLTNVTFLSSAGLVAFHNAYLTFSGKNAPQPDDGWEAMHAIGRSRETGIQPWVKLLNPSPRVLKTLSMSGTLLSYQVFTDEAEALASFQAAV